MSPQHSWMTFLMSPAPDRPNTPPNRDDPAVPPPAPDDPDDVPPTPPTEPPPTPIRDPRPEGQPEGPYISRTAVAIAAVVLTATSAYAQAARSPHVLADPAVLAYTAYVEAYAQAPLDNATIVATMDLFLSALEGIAFARELTDDDIVEQAHNLREEVRRVYPVGTPTARGIQQRQKLFEDAASLLIALNKRLPAADRMNGPRVDAVDRAARSLDWDAPLPQQAQAVERFFRHAAEALRPVAK